MINSDADKQLISDVISESVQDYLKAIYKLSNGNPVTTSLISDRMQVSPASATNMIKMGIALTSIVEIIGWSSTAMLQRYLDTDEKEISKLKMGGSVIAPPLSARVTDASENHHDLGLLMAQPRSCRQV